ncbi:platelet-derived growth factor subunit A-like isoform X4 [Hypanus sabinus]|uniref:platelet-derived growth factor subunit A-like isoform X4 n=1 Tax=Hypanus sabinus TaxID=79690 RepID=UPI0028C46C53|nr:platelet-derived growth factor subunit A-like isoform X4 [Hypanus sabinus]
MDLLQKTAGSNMKSQVLVFLSLFCFWTTISEDMPKDVDKEEGLPDDVLKMIAQANIQSISDLENLLGVKAKDTAEMRPRSRPGKPHWPDSYKASYEYLQQKAHNDELSPPLHRPVVPQESSLQNQQSPFKTVHFMTRAGGCKTRAVTVDVPRYKVDPASVGFFLWPSCVEIQRCSGCCNTKAYKCIPSHATYRPFQIAKITYRYGRKELTIHTVSIREHLSCNCTDLAKLNHSRFPSRYYKQSTDN